MRTRETRSLTSLFYFFMELTELIKVSSSIEFSEFGTSTCRNFCL